METELETAQRQVRESETHLERAQALLADLERAGQDHSAAIVRQTIQSFEAILEGHRLRLERVRRANGD